MHAEGSCVTEGFVSLKSLQTHRKTVQSLLIALKRRGMIIDGHIDYAAGAAEAGMALPPENLIIFTFAEAEGAVLMRHPVLGIVIPRKVLVWQDEAREVWAGYNDPIWIGRRFDVPPETASLLRAMSNSISGIALEACGRGTPG